MTNPRLLCLPCFVFCFGCAVLSAAKAAHDEARQVIDAKYYHLGVAGAAEWAEFETSTPHGPQLDLTFAAQASTSECTLFIWQRNVKTTWNVMLNGRRVGALEPLTQPLVRALAVPAGTLKDGDNKLTIVRPPSRMTDDIVVGEIVLQRRPREKALSEGMLEIAVTDADSRMALPCRITVTNSSGSLVPLHVSADQRLAIRTGVVYSADGKARIGVAPGNYTVYASRGFEYSVAAQLLTVAAGETKRATLQIRREVPTPGFVASDTHIHTLTHSKHGDATIDERMLTIAGEGIEVAVATDHNHHADYSEAADRNRVNAHFRHVVGNEVTTKAGHFNAFPIRPGSAIPNAQLTDWPELLHNIRTLTGAQVITLNHPRDVHQSFTPLGPDNFDAKTGELKKAAKFDCDAIEVVTSAAMQSDIMLLYRDWFALLNRGYRVAGVGSSDTHHVSEFILGQSRTYVACGADEPGRINLDEVWAGYRGGRLLVSMGLLTQMRVNDRFRVGDLATNLGDELRVAIEVLGPSWVTADRLELFANGVKIRDARIAATPQPRKEKVTWTLPRPKHDVHLVAIATGPGVTGPYWEIPRPYQPTSKAFNPRVIGSTNPIWIDGDGDGKFSSAREYAQRVVSGAGGDAAKLKTALVAYDEAVAMQVADLAK